MVMIIIIVIIIIFFFHAFAYFRVFKSLSVCLCSF